MWYDAGCPQSEEACDARDVDTRKRSTAGYVRSSNVENVTGGTEADRIERHEEASALI